MYQDTCARNHKRHNSATLKKKHPSSSGMLHIIISSHNEPKSTLEALRRIKEQELPKEHMIIVSDPFEKIKRLLREHHPDVNVVLDTGEGKSKALNRILKRIWSENTNDIIVFTDGDVFLENGVITAISKKFKNEEVGVVCGHPISMNEKQDKLGWWSHLLFEEMNATRKEADQKNEFFEITGYLFAIRNGIIKEFPVDASEDNVIPTIFYNKGYQIAYAKDARVQVLNPQTFKEWVTQKKRNIKGHLALRSQINVTRNRKNTFLGEAKRGLKFLASHVRTPKDLSWSLQLLVARLYAWSLAYIDVMKGKKYQDGWRIEETKSTSPLD